MSNVDRQVEYLAGPQFLYDEGIRQIGIVLVEDGERKEFHWLMNIDRDYQGSVNDYLAGKCGFSTRFGPSVDEASFSQDSITPSQDLSRIGVYTESGVYLTDQLLEELRETAQ